ncbi:MAG TPA: hypothetical protein PL106_08370, partial [Flavobacteriales bacterium]|nr:hypothetical protein [Flavobacteriales bacterium]
VTEVYGLGNLRAKGVAISGWRTVTFDVLLTDAPCIPRWYADTGKGVRRMLSPNTPRYRLRLYAAAWTAAVAAVPAGK